MTKRVSTTQLLVNRKGSEGHPYIRYLPPLSFFLLILTPPDFGKCVRGKYDNGETGYHNNLMFHQIVGVCERGSIGELHRVLVDFHLIRAGIRRRGVDQYVLYVE